MSEKVGLQEGTSLYLLGQKKSSAFSKYQKLIEKFSSEGSFLTIEESLPWLACYEADSQMIQTMRPLLVFRPKAVSTIAPFVKACCQAGIPVTPRCGGTGLAGGAVASPGGIVLLTGHLKRILQLDKDKGFAVVESGVAPNQLNDALMGTKWHLPFQIPTGGTAGLAGCLSNHAKDSLGRSVQERITQVYLVDGQGEALEAPSALVCGSEGILGIITHMQIKLALNCHQKACFHLALSWPELENRWTELSQFQLLRALVWQGEGKGVIGVLEGESWRVAASRQALDRLFGSCLTHIVNLPSFYERKPLAIELSHSVPYRRLSFLLETAKEIAEKLHLKCEGWGDLCNGSLNLQLLSLHDHPDPSLPFKQFLVVWASLLQKEGGFLVNRYGIGQLLSPYLPPFYDEEELLFLKELSLSFDPQQLFNRHRVLPVEGKSLEKIRI